MKLGRSLLLGGLLAELGWSASLGVRAEVELGDFACDRRGHCSCIGRYGLTGGERIGEICADLDWVVVWDGVVADLSSRSSVVKLVVRQVQESENR